MNCAIVQDLLSERLDAALAPGDECAVAEHLASCARCADVDRRLMSLVEDLALLADVQVPEGLSERIVARVPSPHAVGAASRAASLRRREPHELRRVAGWAAAMIMATLALLGRDFTGRVADNLAPVLAHARQEVTRSRLSGTSLLASLDQRGEAEIQRMTLSLRGSKE